ncbi:MAG: indolepyruvate ferredoxin oxidoreductase subunit alpha [Ruminococcaceae bacterium]|nr:indolepyruvate ferredoxin oxidoreductase subunit alpha [Oscillospiraceae bacterium]
MKQLMIGNEAVARGLYEGGLSLVSSYPGTPSTEITEFLALYDDIHSEWAPNEKVAAEVAFGASLGGVRAACAMKHVGLNVAADPLFTLSYTGVTGGLVICVADDPAMHSSQNEQDSRHYAIAAKVPMLEPADSAEALDFSRRAFDLSEQFDTPVLFRMCTRVSHSQSVVETGERRTVEAKPYVKNGAKYIMMPGNAKKRHPIVEERTKALAAYAENCPFNRVEMGDTDIGIITSGTCYQYVKEVLGDSVSVLKIGMPHPLPEQLFRDFAAKVKTLYVIEELDPVIETHCRNLGLDVIGKQLFSPIGEYSQATIAAAFGIEKKRTVSADSPIPVRPPMMCAGCPHRGIYYTLAKNKVAVLGDIGCYTLGAQPPLSAVDSTLCMGASISGVHGFNLARGEQAAARSVAVIGDSTFMHSGMTGLVNIAYNASNSTVIILDNSITGMTGHQQNPTTGYNIKGDPAAKVDLEALCRALGINRVRVVDPYDLAACDTALKEELAADEPSVIISRRPCVLLKSVKPQPPLTVSENKCRSCKRCATLGCPAISIKGGKAVIDATLCVGCEVCMQLCKFDAILKGGDRA